MYLGTNQITQGRENAYSIDTTDLRPSICRKNITLTPSEQARLDQAAQWGNRLSIIPRERQIGVNGI